MSCVLPSAFVTLSVDLELDPLRPSRDQQKSLDAATEGLVRLLDRYQLPATWAVADPAMSAATEVLVAANSGHEIAIMGDPTWVGVDAGRGRFARELARRVSHGRSAGLEINTLALRGAVLTDHLDLVVKQEITVVRSDFKEQPRRWWSCHLVPQPASLRFGLWDIPAAVRLPGDSSWKLGGGGYHRVRRGIQQVIAGRGVFQLQIDALSLVNRPMSQRKLDQVLHLIASCRDAGNVQVATLAGVGNHLAGPKAATPARSILHPAA